MKSPSVTRCPRVEQARSAIGFAADATEDKVWQMETSLGGSHPDTPRPEHPRPQLVRPTWLTLNGRWEFEMDCGDSGMERGLLDRPLAGSILVPFAPESAASGVGHPDFMSAVWYRRVVRIPQEWTGLRVLLHFGAVDFDATVWVDGVEVVRHRGGFTPFTADLGTSAVPGRSITVTVRARDSRHDLQARGKQATWFANSECLYTPDDRDLADRLAGGSGPHAFPAPPDHPPAGFGDLRRGDAVVGRRLRPHRPRRIARRTRGGSVAPRPAPIWISHRHCTWAVPADRLRVWSPQDPHLYSLRLELVDAAGAVVDAVDCYAGMRSVSIQGTALLLNGKPLFQRLVLDQGFWPDTLMTAPTDQALVRDIELGIAAGFNGARLHQKVFEERYLYHADRMGYLCWAEFGDWGVSGQGPVGDNQKPTASFVAEWAEVLERDHNHPSIVGWCPLNETHQAMHDRFTALDDVTQAMFRTTKLADPSRPVIDASGYSHRVQDTDVYDSHSYEQDPEEFAVLLSGLAAGRPFVNRTNAGDLPMSVAYRGQPYFVSEFGGIWWDPDQAGRLSGNDTAMSWGYGQRVRDEADFQQRFAGLTAVLLDDPGMFGYCYTQLTDVFQEQNGLYRFDRTEKLDIAMVRRAQLRPAAFESGVDGSPAHRVHDDR